MRERIDVVVDLETLGTASDAPVLQIGAVAVDLQTGKTLDKFETFISIEQETVELSGATLIWWLETNPSLLKDIVLAGKVSPQAAWERFQHWLAYQARCAMDVYLWGNGIAFDNAIAQQAFRKHKLTSPVKYTHERDFRTVVDMTGLLLGLRGSAAVAQFFGIHNTQKHDAMADAVFEAELLVCCYDVLVKGVRA